MKKAALENLLEKLSELLRTHPDNQPMQIDHEPFEMQLHRFVEHMHVSRHVVEVFDDGLVKLSFGNGEGDKATFSKHGFAMSLTNAVALIYTMREMMMKQGHPDPFPPQQTIYTNFAGAGGGGSAAYHTSAGGGGASGGAYVSQPGYAVSQGAGGEGHSPDRFVPPVDDPRVLVVVHRPDGTFEPRRMPVSIIDAHSTPV